jgi:hypothetical protein
MYYWVHVHCPTGAGSSDRPLVLIDSLDFFFKVNHRRQIQIFSLSLC